MKGAFLPGDVLRVSPLPWQKIRPGDIIAFHTHDGIQPSHIIVHRVRACVPDGLLTQGDACLSPDAFAVGAAQVIGRVTQVQRGNKSHIVWGGFVGRLWVRYVRLRRGLLAFGRAPYRWVRASGILRRLWRPSVVSVIVATAEGPMVKYLCGGKTVAVWQPETRAYWCRKPYDLVLERPATTDK